MLQEGNFYGDQQRFTYKLIEAMQAKGTPIDGIGCQMYIRSAGDKADGEAVYKLLQRLERFHLELKITEFGYMEKDETLQAIKYIDILTAVYSHPMTTAFIVWWPWGSAKAQEYGYLTRQNRLRPMGEAYAYLVFGKWWTEESGKTGNDGKFGVRGFYGEYEIVVTYNGQTRTDRVKFFKNGEKSFEVRF